MLLKVTPSTLSIGNPKATPGPAEGCDYVKVMDIPDGVSPAQVMLPFTHTVKSIAGHDPRYEFHFSELCPGAF